MKIIIIIWFLVSCAHCSFSQSRGHYTRDSLLRTVLVKRSFFGFSISPYIVNKAKATPLSGPYRLKTIYMNGFEAGPNYNIKINNSYSIIVGLHGGAAARNIKFFISKNQFNPNLLFDVYLNGALAREWDFYMNMPILVEKRWFTNKNNLWNLDAGVNIRYYPRRYYGEEVEDDEQDVNGNIVKVLNISDSIGNNLRPWINYNISGGYSILLRNNNYLQCNLIANFSPKKLVNGVYQINVSGKPQSTGKYSANLSYIGLSFSYILTGGNKHLRKMYEEKLKSKN